MRGDLYYYVSRQKASGRTLLAKIVISIIVTLTTLPGRATAETLTPVSGQGAAAQAQPHRHQGEAGGASQAGSKTAQEAYACPMHPEVTSGKPGTCPKCGMALVKGEKSAASGQGGQKPALKDEHAEHTTSVERDGQQATQPSINLADLERIALKNNPTLAQAESAVRAAEGRRKQAGLWPNPVLGYQGEEFAFRAFSDKAEHIFFWEQEIPLGGKLKKSKRVFESGRAEAEAGVEAQRYRVLTTVRMLYYQTLGAQKLVEARRELAKLHVEAVGVTEELMNVGQADLPDQLEIEVESQQADLDLVKAENDLSLVWLELAAVVGDPGLRQGRLSGDLDKGIPAVDREQMASFIITASPEVKAARAKIERAQAVISRAKAERTPDMIVRGGLGYNTERLELGDSPFQRRTGPEASLEVGFRVPLFNRNQGNIAASEAELAAAEAELRRVELSLRARFARAFTNYEIAQRTVTSYQQNILPRAKRSFDLYQARFGEMAAAYPQVLIARRSYHRAQAEYTKALVSLWQQGLSMQGFLLGGGLDASGETRTEIGGRSQNEGGEDR